MAEFPLQIHDIDEAGKDYAFSLSTQWLDASLADAGLRSDPEHGAGTVTAHAQKNGAAEYLVHGRMDAELLTDCVRCLGDAKVAVHVDFGSLYTRSDMRADGRPAKVQPEELEIDDADDDNLQRETFTGHQIDLDALLREHLVLECPMRPLCSPDCEGIAVPAHLRPPEDVFGPTAGGVDPRLAPLMRLRDKVPPNKS